MIGVLGKLRIVIGADASGVGKGVASASAQLGKLDGAAAMALRRVAAFAIGAASAAAAVGSLGESMSKIDAQAKLARELGGTTIAVQALEREAEKARVSSDELASAAQNLNKKLGEAQRDGMSEAAEALGRLGLKAGDLAKLDVDQRMAAIADRIQKLGLSASVSADVLDKLGMEGKGMAALFERGGDSIRTARQEVIDFGVAVSDVDAAKIEQANEAMTIFGFAARGAGNALAVELAPIIRGVSEEFKTLAKEGGGFGGAVRQGVDIAVGVFGVLLDLAEEFRQAWHMVTRGITDSVNALIKGVNAASEFLGLGKAIEEIEPVSLTRAMNGLLGQFGLLSGAAHDLRRDAGAPPPSEGWKQWVEDVRKRSQEAAEATVAARRAMGLGSGGETAGGVSDAERKRLEDRLTRLRQSVASEDEVLKLQREKQLRDLADFEQQRIIKTDEANALRRQIEDKHQLAMRELLQARFEETWLTEDELIARKYEKQLADLAQFEANRTLTVEQAAEMRRQIEQRAAADILQAQASAYGQLAGIVDSAMGNISAIMEDEGNKGFTIMKAISMATALVKGFEAAVSAYAFGAKIGGPPLGAVMAGVAAAGTAALIAKIAGVGPKSKGSGGGAAVAASGGGGGGGFGAGGASAGGQDAPGRTLTVQGIDPTHIFTGRVMRDLVERIEDWRKDGDTVADRNRVVFA